VAVGGVNLLKALAGPFPDVAFCPTGGITPETAPQFLKLPNVKVCGGSWLTPQDAVDAKRLGAHHPAGPRGQRCCG
jgi:2-dehydro-3-deoxyphosphogluconate aldolase/(4S)-4-hydroxy-2-oxoglutarate aldolase